MNSNEWIEICEAADLLGRENLYFNLKQKNILDKNGMPKQEYIDQGLFKIKQEEIIYENFIGGCLKYQALVNARGIIFIKEALKDVPFDDLRPEDLPPEFREIY